jgi:hypothetical protein
MDRLAELKKNNGSVAIDINEVETGTMLNFIYIYILSSLTSYLKTP